MSRVNRSHHDLGTARWERKRDAAKRAAAASARPIRMPDGKVLNLRSVEERVALRSGEEHDHVFDDVTERCRCGRHKLRQFLKRVRRHMRKLRRRRLAWWAR